MGRHKATAWYLRGRARRPVSRLRRVMGLLLLLLLVGGAIVYHQVTDEDRLRGYAEQWLREFSGGEVHIDRIHLDPFHGLDLRGVTVATPEAARFDVHDNSLAGRTIFRSRGLFLRLRPFSFITGNLVVPEIVATDPELSLIHRLADDARSWQVLFKQRPKQAGSGPMRLPVIRMRNLRVVQYRLDEAGRSGGAVQVLWADAQSARGETDAYDLKVAKIFSDGQETTREEGRLRINMHTLAVSGSIPSMSVEDLATSTPAEILRRLDVLGLRGFVRADAIKFDPRTGGEAELTLRDAALSVPISEAEENLPPDQRWLQFSGIAGRVHVKGNRATLDIAGRFRDSPATLRGEVTLGNGEVTLEGVGFDIHLAATGVMLPTNDENTPPAERRFAERWFRLREFVADYDPRGRADLTFHVLKTPGKDKGIQVVEGTLAPRNTSARYFRFPYRLYEVGGVIYFRPDGRIELRGLCGNHGRGRAVINGLVDGYISQGLDVDVRSESIALDDDLVRCLDEKDRNLIRKFNAQAVMNIGIQLHRDSKPHGLPVHENPWKAAVDVEFKDGSVSYVDFPYPLNGLRGQMRIEGGGFEVKSVRAGRGEAAVEVSGRVRRGEQGPADVDLNLDARRVPLDDVLLAALPADARAMYNRISPAGRVDVSGRITATAREDSVGYDLAATMEDGELGLPDTQVRLAGVQSRIRMTPDQLSIESLRGWFGESSLSLSGRIGTRQEDHSLSLRLTSDRLLLDEKLRAALPEAVQPMWQAVKPGGVVRLDLALEQGAVTSRASAEFSPSPVASASNEGELGLSNSPSPPTTQPVSYTAIIDATDCTATLEEFPLPLTRVNGRFTLMPGSVALENVSAWHEQTSFKLAGRMALQAERLSGRLALDVDNLTFSESLRKAVPWRMRRLWNEVRPEGRVDISLSRLTFDYGPQSHGWAAEGRVDLDDFTIQVGSPLSGLKGRVSGRGGAAQSVSLDLDLALERAEVDGRLITGVRAHMSRPAGDPRMRVTGFQAGFCGGQVIGELEVNYAEGRPRYGLSLAARGVSLEQFLNSKPAAGQAPTQARGTLEGSLAMAGRFGDSAGRMGSGSVFIRQAEMVKLPLFLSIFQLAPGKVDTSAFHDARFTYLIKGDDLLLDEIDLRGKSLSMVGAGRVHMPTDGLDLVLLLGSSLRLPQIQVLSELMESMARGLMEVHVGGTLGKPEFQGENVRNAKKTLDAVLSIRRQPGRR